MSESLSERDDLEIPEDKISRLKDASLQDENIDSFVLESLNLFLPTNISQENVKDKLQLFFFLEKFQSNMQVLFSAIQDLQNMTVKELKKRPTFSQAFQEITFNIDNQVIEQVQKTINEKQLKSKLQNNLSFQNSNNQFHQQSFLSPQKSNENYAVDIQIQEKYVQKLISQLRIDQQEKYDDMRKIFEKNMQKLVKFIEISDVSFPRVERLTEKAVKKSDRAQRILEVQTIRNFKINQIRDVWRSFMQNQNHQKKTRIQVRNVLTYLRKYYMRLAIRRWRKITLFLKEVTRKDSVAGAEYKLNTFQTKLNSIEQFIILLQNQKISFSDFEILKQDILSNKSEQIFNDMRDLLDVTVFNLSQQIQEIKSNQQKLQLKAKESMLNNNSMQQIQFEFKKLYEKINIMEQQIQKIFLEQGQISSQFGAQLLQSQQIFENIQKIQIEIQNNNQVFAHKKENLNIQQSNKTLILEDKQQIMASISENKLLIDIMQNSIKELIEKIDQLKMEKENNQYHSELNERYYENIKFSLLESLAHEVQINNQKNSPLNKDLNKFSSIQTSILQTEQPNVISTEAELKYNSQRFNSKQINQRSQSIQECQTAFQNYPTSQSRNSLRIKKRIHRPQTSASAMSQYADLNNINSNWEIINIRQKIKEAGIPDYSKVVDFKNTFRQKNGTFQKIKTYKIFGENEQQFKTKK